MNPLNGLSFLTSRSSTITSFRRQISLTRLERLNFAIQVYYLQNRGFPQDLNYLVVGGLVQAEDLRDPWDREYRYKTTPAGYELHGLNAQGSPDPELSVRSGSPL